MQRQLAELQTRVVPSEPVKGSEEIKNVLFYLTNSVPYTQSGYTERSHKILTALKRSGINVRAVTRLGYPLVIGYFVKKDWIRVSGVDYRFLLPWFYPGNWERRLQLSVDMLVHEAREYKADIIHTTTDFKNAIIVSRAARQLKIPWVYEVRGELEKTWLSKRTLSDRPFASQSEFYKMSRLRELEAMLAASATISLSDVSRRDAIVRGVDQEKILVIPNAISEDDLGIEFDKNSVRTELNLPDKFIVGTVSSIVPYEGLDDLLRSVSLLEEVHCLIVGEGISRPPLEELARELGIEDRVVFAGKQPSSSVWKWYAALDVFVVPRKDDEVCRNVTPIKPLRAQAMGVPVIASDLPALREITGNVAFYAPPEDPVNLAHSIAHVHKLSPNELSRIKHQGIDWVKDRTWSANAGRLIRMYRKL